MCLRTLRLYAHHVQRALASPRNTFPSTSAVSSLEFSSSRGMPFWFTTKNSRFAHLRYRASVHKRCTISETTCQTGYSFVDLRATFVVRVFFFARCFSAQYNLLPIVRGMVLEEDPRTALQVFRQSGFRVQRSSHRLSEDERLQEKPTKALQK